MLSIRTRLTYWYVGVLMAILLGYGAAIYLYLSRSLLKAIDAALVRQVSRIELRLNALARGAEPPNEHSDRLTLAPDFVELIDRQGQVTDFAGEREEHRVALRPETLRRAAVSTDPVLENLTTGDGKPMRVATWRSLGDDGVLDYFIRAGYLLSDLQSAQRQMLITLGAAMAIALGLGGYGGWLLAGKALRPVDRITAAARSISASNLKERVDVPKTADELSRLAHTFNQMIARLDEAFDRERRFTDDASHELRTPLAVMRSEIEIALRRVRPPEEYHLVLQRLLDEILRLSNLADDLLMLARSDTGRLMLEKNVLQLDQLGREMGDFVRPLAAERRIKLDFISQSPGPSVIGDQRRLKQLLLNLLENALKFTPANGRIKMSVSSAGGEAILSVEDSGSGITPEDLPYIFDRFFHQSQRGEDGKVGHGLGLSICKWIAEAHGGRIEVQSTVGAGTQVKVHLPLT